MKEKLILLVDDNSLLLQDVKKRLSGAYPKLYAVRSGDAALRVCATRQPDLILLDLEMPVMDGYEVLAALKSKALTQDIPVIFLTAQHSAESEAKALRLGAVDFVTKPFDASVLSYRMDLHLRLAAYHYDMEYALAQAEDNIISGLSSLLETRDHLTFGHAERTARYLEVLGSHLIAKQAFPDDLTPTVLEMMVRAAPLHDIGKVGMPDSVLLKPDRLTSEEMSTMQEHPTIGGKVLASMYAKTPSQRFLRYAAQIAYSHHERYDGHGYPDGNAKSDIPMAARLMAIPDVYDAITSKRVYRQAMSHPEAVRVVREGSGSFFDPVMVDAFLEVQHEFERIAAEYKPEPEPETEILP
jgi:putative two-component system response regulator